VSSSHSNALKSAPLLQRVLQFRARYRFVVPPRLYHHFLLSETTSRCRLLFFPARHRTNSRAAVCMCARAPFVISAREMPRDMGEKKRTRIYRALPSPLPLPLGETREKIRRVMVARLRGLKARPRDIEINARVNPPAPCGELTRDL